MTPRRILVVNVNWVGDALFSTPAIRALKKRFPSAEIDCLLPARCAPVFEGNPYVTRVIVADDDTTALAFSSSLALAFRLRRERYDLAVLFHRSRTKAWVAKAAGIPERWGYEGKSRYFLTNAVPAPDAKLHRTDGYLALVNAMGCPTDGRQPDFFSSQAAQTEARRLLVDANVSPDGPYVVVHAGGNWDLKRWPAESFAHWIRLFRRACDWNVVLCGTASETALCDEIVSSAGPGGVVSLCGKTSLGGLAALLKGSRFLVSNDSGPIHLAASQEVPTLALFGPTLPELTGPISRARVLALRKDVGCEVPCYFRACAHHECLRELKPEEVLEKSLELANGV